jgi:hypothetical protein
LKSIAFQFSSDCEREYVFFLIPNTGTFVQVLTISSIFYDFSGDLVHGKLMEWFFFIENSIRIGNKMLKMKSTLMFMAFVYGWMDGWMDGWKFSCRSL